MKRLSLIFVIAASVLVILSSIPQAKTTDCAVAAKLSEEAADLAAANPAGAEKRLREAIMLCNQSASLHYNLGMALYQQNKRDEAELSIEQALKLNPEYAKSLNALAYMFITRHGGDRTRAKLMAEKAVSLDPRNQQYRNTLEMIVGNVDAPPRTKMHRPDGIALIIGNKSYKNTILPQVKYAVQDASIMKKYLVETLGFEENNVYTLKDATHIDFIKYFGTEGDHKGILYNRTRKDRSDIFIFYSGHGAPDTNTKKAYLVPSDADPSIIKLTGYSLDTLYDNLAKLTKDKNPRSLTLVLDACFSGGSNEGMLIPNASPIFIEASSPALNMKNAVVFTSSRGNQISSWYPEKNHGLFTYFFLKTIKDAAEEGKKLTAGDLEKALLDSDSVNDYAWRLYNREQEPQVTGDKGIVLVQ